SLGNTAPAAPSTATGARFLLSYAYSTDGGDSWSDPLPVNPYLTPVTSVNFERLPPHFRREYFALPGVEGQEEVRVKFTWAGDLFFWAIDDVAIVERPSIDLRTNRNFHARTPNTVTPISQLTDVPLLADVENIGAQPVEDIQQTFTATTDGQTVYTDEQTINALEVDSLFENQLFPNLLPAEALQATGQYRAAYGLAGQGATQRPEDDQRHWSFAVSDTLFAKEFGFTRDVTPISAFNYTYGNCFYVPNGEGWYARTMSFAVGNADQLSDADRFVNTFLYEWAGDLNGNGKADGEELEEKAFNFYKFEGDEGVQQITVPVSSDGVGIALKDSTYYLAMVSYGAIQQPPLFMLVSDTIDYQATYFAHEQAGLPRRYGGMLQVGGEGELSFETVGFGLNIVPTVRLSIGESPVLSSQERLLPASSLQVSPNPARAEVQTAIDLPADSKPAQLRLFRPNGQLLRSWPLGELQRTQAFSVATLPAGLYVLELRTAAGRRSVKLVVED
ncbi:MAG TPA: T9SS type A sorting domain-containing protein, partial [Phaeodactylibacter sp.]|nr:T9SS type A sorting domain-containing protein [Phaeodactylibacter sp.]